VTVHRVLRRLTLCAALALAAFAGTATAAQMSKLISLDADDASLPAVLKILAEKGDLNIITGPGVASGKLTIHMKDVPVDQAINLVVRAAGLGYERIGNSVLVAEAKSLKDETGLSSYIVPLKFADANEAKAALHGLCEQIEVDHTGNRLIVVTSPRIIAEIENVVAELDKPARQVMLEARITEVSTDDLKKLGIDWDLLNKQTFIFAEGKYDSLSGTANGSTTDFTGLKVFNNSDGKGVLEVRDFSRIAKTFNVTLDLLIHNGNARVLANPKIATLNGKEASILIGSRVPYQTSGTTFAGGGAAQVTTVQKEEVGVKLRITPVINADGFITTQISPEVSSVVGFKGQNNDLPVVDTRQATTTVRLKDGSSIIIGGLLSEDRSTSMTKVPILGDIPVLGYFFQHRVVTTSKKDLVIEITPHILADPQ
jgi:type IV pilus secretin PilQ/predicted competence protein